MSGIAGRMIPSLARVGLVFGLIAIAPRGCERAEPVMPAATATSSGSVFVMFEADSDEAAPGALASLDPIADRASANLSVRLLIVGVANERHSLVDNLALAERRSGVVVEHMIARGVGRPQMVMVAREASADDPMGWRCDVEILDPTRPAMYAMADEPTTL